MPLRSIARRAQAALVLVATLTVSASSIAFDRELSESPDFRVRVQAALRLGRAGSPARTDLEGGLRDAHPAVRVACAVALGNMGDRAALPALEAAARAETFASAKETITQAAKKLKSSGSTDPAAGLDGAKYVVQLGELRNTSGVGASSFDGVMRDAARGRARTFKGALFVEGRDAALIRRAEQKQIPILQLDGNLTRLTQSRAKDGGVIVSAQVDLTIRKVPQQILKGMVKGSASASDDARASSRAITALQERAVGGAVESAMSSVSSDLAALVK